ncbi:hypothetical protein KLP28_16355 [Nocardioidaceae bacterium]|nr:hypothetical protein KLP28_16355 [Nocardioidaceae bacterium]
MVEQPVDELVPLGVRVDVDIALQRTPHGDLARDRLQHQRRPSARRQRAGVGRLRVRQRDNQRAG